MGNANVAVLGGSIAPSIGKKGTVTDVTFYEIKKGSDSVTLLEPSKYPEKLSSLFYSVAMSDYALLVVEAINANLGETIVMADAAGLSNGWIVLRNYIQKEQLAPLFAGTVFESYEYVEDDPIAIRELLLKTAAERPREPGQGTRGTCPVDSHFNVKGVGTVVLGSVVDGHFRKHDKMKVLPQNKEVVLKSIQIHDADADIAVKGDHVGLALRGIESDDLDRGQVLTTDPAMKVSESFSGKAKLVTFWPSPLKEGMVLHLGHWMQMVPCRVSSVSDGGDFRNPDVSLSFESPVIHLPGGRGILMYLEGGKLRIVGSVSLN